MNPGALPLPSVGDWVVAMVTAVVSATRFYIQMPLGPKCSFLAGDNSSSETGKYTFHLNKITYLLDQGFIGSLGEILSLWDSR